MSKHSATHVEEDAARLGLIKTRVGPDFRTIRWHLKCSKCPADFAASWDAGMNPDAMARQLRKRQWDVGYGMRPLCPTCAHSKDKGPVAKPEHQNFKRWVPPGTLVFDRLLDAANKKAAETRRPQLVAELEDVRGKLADIRAERRAVREALTAEARLAGQQARAAYARKMRLERIVEERAKAALEPFTSAPEQPAVQNDAPLNQTPQVTQEPAAMQPTIKPVIAPAPKISHAVFQCLDGVFDPAKRLYRSGYTDQRVAKECGTSQEVVAYLRTETFGQLAEDPRISAIRDDLELLRMEAAETFAKLQKQMGEISSRVEQLAHP